MDTQYTEDLKNDAKELACLRKELRDTQDALNILKKRSGHNI